MEVRPGLGGGRVRVSRDRGAFIVVSILIILPGGLGDDI